MYPHTFTEDRVTAIQTIGFHGERIRHNSMALWVAKGDPRIQIIGGRSDRHAARPSGPVSLRKSYV